MLSWARFSAQFLHVQYVLSCVDFIKDVQPKDIRNLISSDEMHSQAGDTELVLWCFVEDSTAPLRAKRAISGQASATTRAALAQLQQYMKAHDVMNWMAQDQSFIPREPAHVGLILNLVKLSDTFSQIFSISLVWWYLMFQFGLQVNEFEP